MGLGQRRGSGMAMVDESFSAEPRAMSNGTKIILEGCSGSPSFSQHVLYESARRKSVGNVVVQDVKRWAILRCKT
eukprot:scaffold15090_cov50-Cyclotella_meneghiniana.AAC.1